MPFRACEVMGGGHRVTADWVLRASSRCFRRATGIPPTKNPPKTRTHSTKPPKSSTHGMALGSKDPGLKGHTVEEARKSEKFRRPPLPRFSLRGHTCTQSRPRHRTGRDASKRVEYTVEFLCRMPRSSGRGYSSGYSVPLSLNPKP